MSHDPGDGVLDALRVVDDPGVVGEEPSADDTLVLAALDGRPLGTAGSAETVTAKKASRIRESARTGVFIAVMMVARELLHNPGGRRRREGKAGGSQ